ncbi:3-oxoacyl-[acyl-carrier-protein] synthase III C-terminal domain-containing protein [Deferrisoma camini]|uniref:3-oxoacyl-[acyl-carrier-protein] synthase III C-terminal domain-containing protein n=1 Tax=Deferrisoma camini TaxID=1035120 RepID=UPI00046D1F62|nr:3-oxoacyl-[acyl-carrier-protein] synthase III C-terminal domain-containing protein [Deferrisoma camini]
MSPSEASIGIVSHGVYLPLRRETAARVASRAGLGKEEVEALGIRCRPVPGPGDHPVPMAVQAARQALARGGVEPEQVDVVIWTGEEYKDYVAQTAAIRLQEEVGCRNAWAFDLVGQGVTSLVGLRVARDLMMGDDTIRTVLLAGGTRNVDLVDPRNPQTRFLLAYSASGGALLLRKDHPRNRLLGLAFHVDPDMADAVYVPGGGTEQPFCEENLGTPAMFFQTAAPAALAEYLATRFPTGLVAVARVALQGRRPDYLALRHLPPAVREQILSTLGIRDRRSASLAEWGHHGTNDVILSLELGVRSGALRNGDLTVLVSAGIGFTYAAATVQWGPG